MQKHKESVKRNEMIEKKRKRATRRDRKNGEEKRQEQKRKTKKWYLSMNRRTEKK